MKLRTRTIERLRDALLQSGRRPSAVVSSAFETLARQGLLNAEEKAAMARVDAVAETMFLVMAADELIAETELAAIRGAIHGLTGQALGDGIIKVMIEDFALRLKDEGRTARVAAIAKAVQFNPDEAESALALAAAVALADNEVSTTEDDFVTELAAAFGFTDETVQRVLDQLAQD